MEWFKFLKYKKWLGINPDDDSDDFQPEVGVDAEIYGSEGIWKEFNAFNFYLFRSNRVFLFYLFGVHVNTI